MSEKNEQTGGRNTGRQQSRGTGKPRRSYPSGATYTSLCQIIDACGRNGVRHIELGNGVVIDFGAAAYNEQPELTSIDYSPKVVDNRNVPLHTPVEVAQVDDAMQMEMELDDLALTDPVTYEQLVINKMAEGITND